VHDCNPLVVGRQGCDANTRLDGSNLINGVTQAPVRRWGVTGPPYASYVDPDLKSTANDEIVAGAEYEVLPSARAGVTYTHRNLVRTVEDMSNNDGQTYFIGNPGSGIADAFPQGREDVPRESPSSSPRASPTWLAQVSYTWSKLTGNYDGLFNAQGLNALGAPQLDPNINSTFDLRTLLLNQQGPAERGHHSLDQGLPGQGVRHHPDLQRHARRILQRKLRHADQCAGRSPPSTVRARPSSSSAGAQAVSPGSPRSTPRVNLNYRLGKDSVITAAVEGFNIFNSQRPLSVDENYTQATVSPILGARQGSVPTQFGGICATAAATSCAQGNGSLPKPHVDPSSATGAAIRVGLPNRKRRPLFRGDQPHLGHSHQLPAGAAVPVQPAVHVLAMDTTMRTPLFCLLLAATACGSMVPPECQMLPSAQGGYVLRFTRVGAASPGCDTQTPAETSDIWIFDTLADSEVRAHAGADHALRRDEPGPAARGSHRRGRVHPAGRRRRRLLQRGQLEHDDRRHPSPTEAGICRRWAAPRTRTPSVKAEVTMTVRGLHRRVHRAGALPGGDLRERRGLRSVQATLQLGHLQHLRSGLQDRPLDRTGDHLLRELRGVLPQPGLPDLK
jgi:hypothetical protein